MWGLTNSGARQFVMMNLRRQVVVLAEEGQRVLVSEVQRLRALLGLAELFYPLCIPPAGHPDT